MHRSKERPEVLADTVYNDTLKHWILMMTNGVTDPFYDWVLSDDNFTQMMEKKYPNKYAIVEYSPNFFRVGEDLIDFNSGLTDEIADLFKFLLKDYSQFYDQLSEIIISDEYWTFYSDSKTRIFTTANDLQSQLYTLKYFEKTVYPGRQLGDYSYIDLRVTKQVVVKEKYQKG